MIKEKFSNKDLQRSVFFKYGMNYIEVKSGTSYQLFIKNLEEFKCKINECVFVIEINNKPQVSKISKNNWTNVIKINYRLGNNVIKIVQKKYLKKCDCTFVFQGNILFCKKCGNVLNKVNKMLV